MSSVASSSTGTPITFGDSVVNKDSSDHAFYVNKSDIHGNPLVSEVLVGRHNFVQWRKVMGIALSARDKLEFVEGQIPVPADVKQKARWYRCNNVIMTWILNSVSKNVVGQILHSETEIANLMQGDMDVSSYHEKLVNLWHELDSMRKYKVGEIADECTRCLETKSLYDQEKEEGRVIKFLMGLNEALAHIRTHILALRELPTLDVAYDMMISNESERHVTKSNVVEASAMNAQQETTYRQQTVNKSGGNAFNNAGVGRVKTNGSQRPYCTHC
ncbi:unnamed protein product [Rhodiola kirilowii]